MASSTADFDKALEIVRRLTPEEQERLVEQIARESPLPRELESLYGLLRGRGPSPSIDEIRQARREMWANFGADEV